MIELKAKNIQDLYTKACKKLGCSILDLDIQIIQEPYNILGIFKKPAIAHVSLKQDKNIDKITPCKNIAHKSYENTKKTFSTKTNDIANNNIFTKNNINIVKNFHQNTDIYNAKILQEIKETINDVFIMDCLNTELVEISFFKDKTIYIKLDGKDTALLIGKNGHRYKALSYLLFTWIYSKYHFFIRLEIGSFLYNQNIMIKKHLKIFINHIYKNGQGDTNVLDGLLLHLALEHLRNVFPRKSITIQTNPNDTSFIRVKDFNPHEKH